MASEAAIKAGIAAGVAALMALSAAAQWQLQDGSPRLAVLCALAALAPLTLVWRGLGKLALRRPVPEAAIAVAMTTGQARHADRLDPLALAAQIEHAPIALFRIEHLGGAGPVTALNASARRVLAPGRASAPQQLHQLLAQQPPGQRRLVSFDTERGAERALVAVSALTLHGAGHRLAALMPVESELEAEALNAWRQLVQVLTHEIMNSLTPVASLSRTAYDLLDEAKAGLAPDVSADLGTALDAISRRAASLVDFVASYRSLSTLPQAQPERVALDALFARLAALLAPAWQARGGRAEFSVEPASLEAMIDAGQLEQALINLVKNAAEASAGMAAPLVRVQARLSRGGRLRIDVTDNGPGVPDALAAHIFTPFFSTKKQGRGIGLAMVRHLVHGNGGTVRYARPVSAGACFVLTF